MSLPVSRRPRSDWQLIHDSSLTSSDPDLVLPIPKLVSLGAQSAGKSTMCVPAADSHTCSSHCVR